MSGSNRSRGSDRNRIRNNAAKYKLTWWQSIAEGSQKSMRRRTVKITTDLLRTEEDAIYRHDFMMVFRQYFFKDDIYYFFNIAASAVGKKGEME